MGKTKDHGGQPTAPQSRSQTTVISLTEAQAIVADRSRPVQEDPALNAELNTAINDVLGMAPLPPGQPEVIPEGTAELPGQHPVLIGLAGAARSGKDMVAAHLEGTYARAERLAISDGIIAEVNEYLAGTGHCITQENKSEPPYRKLLQEWGMARSRPNPDYWIDKVLQIADDKFSAGSQLVMITGVRRPTEAEAIRQHGYLGAEPSGQLWRVVRPGNTYSADHEIERMMDNVPADVTLSNDREGDMDHVQGRAREEMEALSQQTSHLATERPTIATVS